ncbi:MAG TPA: hypothetical protein VN372_12135, partial [Methanospirillum sp.]|nr:hypothetical protein [Methanospirillum sp.]
LSNTAQFEEEEVERSFLPGSYERLPYHYYNITIVSPSLFNEYYDKRQSSDNLLKNKGKNVAIVSDTRLILINDITLKDREHFLIRGILWSMGFHGETTKYQDSFFYRGGNVNTKFSLMDEDAIRLLYGGRLQSGMDVESIKKALNLKTKKNS